VLGEQFRRGAAAGKPRLRACLTRPNAAPRVERDDLFQIELRRIAYRLQRGNRRMIGPSLLIEPRRCLRDVSRSNVPARLLRCGELFDFLDQHSRISTAFHQRVEFRFGRLARVRTVPAGIRFPKFIKPRRRARRSSACDRPRFCLFLFSPLLYPDAPPTTVNRQFYTPVSAILKRAGMEREIARPKGWRGSKATSWLEPAEAFAVINEAYAIDAEFGLFCLTLLYTGMRLSDPLNSRLRDLKLDRALLYVPDTKNREPRPVHLPSDRLSSDHAPQTDANPARSSLPHFQRSACLS
jgi:hypothetical protein